MLRHSDAPLGLGTRDGLQMYANGTRFVCSMEPDHRSVSGMGGSLSFFLRNELMMSRTPSHVIESTIAYESRFSKPAYWVRRASGWGNAPVGDQGMVKIMWRGMRSRSATWMCPARGSGLVRGPG